MHHKNLRSIHYIVIVIRNCTHNNIECIGVIMRLCLCVCSCVSEFEMCDSDFPVYDFMNYDSHPITVHIHIETNQYHDEAVYFRCVCVRVQQMQSTCIVFKISMLSYIALVRAIEYIEILTENKNIFYFFSL